MIFFEGGTFETWQALSTNPTRGITVQADSDTPKASQVRDANTQTVVKRANLNSLLTTIAAYCPEGMFKTIIVDSTSINWIRNRLIKVCNIESNGRHLPKALNIVFNRGEESPAAFFERIKSTFIDSLMPAGTLFHGVPLATHETLNPTFESVIVILCLKAIHPELPEFIMQNKGMLFTTATPNFCDIQEEIWETMDTLLAQMEAQDSIQRLQIKDSSEECLRWANLQRKSSNRSFQTPRNANKSNTRQYKSNKVSCDYCFAMGKDEKTWASHDKLNCYLLFPEKKRTKLNARMLSVPILTDDNETWDLQQALDSVTEQYYASHAEEESLNPPGEDLSPQ